jgi:ubiquinone/menaquinone biosynthesis C-methylase UbiE
VRLTVHGLERLTRDLGPGAELSIVDVATGGADIPRALLGWAARRGLRARVVATDISLEMLDIAAKYAPPGIHAPPGVQPVSQTDAEAGTAAITGMAAAPRMNAPPGIHLVAADARALPFADGSVDVAICSLVLHHLRPDDAVAMLREMRRVARLGIVVNDLDRNWLGFAGAWLAGRLLTRNPLTRHDGPLSFRRAYTRREMTALAKRAGLGPVRFEGFLGYRQAMTARAMPAGATSEGATGNGATAAKSTSDDAPSDAAGTVTGAGRPG